MIHKFTLLLFCLLLSTEGDCNPTDSLLSILPKAQTSQMRYTIYRNLADLHEGDSLEKYYLQRALDAAKESKDIPAEMITLRDLAVSYRFKDNMDSAVIYLNQLEALPDINIKMGVKTSLNMYIFKVLFAFNRSSEALNLEIKKYDLAARGGDDLYAKIESAYKVATALYKDEAPKPSLPYYLEADKLAAQLPFEEGYFIRLLTLKAISHYYLSIRDFDKALELSEELLSLYDEYYKKYIQSERPFYKTESSYLSVASSLIICAGMVQPDRLQEYAKKTESVLRIATAPDDKYRGFLGMNNYYLLLEDYKEALATNDSLIKYAAQIAPENLPGLYDISSQILEAMGSYKGALDMLKKSQVLKDTLNTSNMQKQLNELQVKYNLDKLNYEKSELENKNKLIIVICLSVILFVALFICIYLYRNMKKEQRMKVYIRDLMKKAEESEEMKTAFINSICHEIRTPLNGIVGFAEMIFDESIDKDMRQTFPDEIQRNTKALTSLIDVMLEVSNLGVSKERFDCKPIDINYICEQQIDKITQCGKSELKFQLELPAEKVVSNSHEHYLSLVLEQLLSNANKFTDDGHVILNLTKDERQQLFILRVSDTGCGIPFEKHEAVFERFMKIDSYIPGNGLGLYLCKLIVNRMGGEICIDSTYSSGTSVVVTLPLAL